MEYLAHIDEKNKDREQSLKDHLYNVALLAEQNSIEKFKKYAYLCGITHDIGKYTNKFQKRIRGADIRVEHACCGAKEIKDTCINNKDIFPVLAEYCVAGHHSGLPDGGTRCDNPEDATLHAKLQRETEDFSAYKEEITFDFGNASLNQYILENSHNNQEEIVELSAFLVRYFFSCLTDADFLDTEHFCNMDINRGIRGDFETAFKKLNDKFATFKADTAVKKARNSLQHMAFDAVEKDSDIYLLNMPTGSGKTLCSLYMALKLLKMTNKKRIIYVIPYTSIIEQTAQTFEEIFGQTLPVLQHYSNFDFDKEEINEESDTTEEKLRRSCENWDADLIITTNVQFFESLYHNRSSRLRKMHNMADSIIIFDEVHMMPTNYLKPCIRGVGYITKHLNSKAIFMTATMPDYSEMFKKYIPDNSVNEVIKDKSAFKAFSNYRIDYIGEKSKENIAERAAEYSSTLIVVNSRKNARELYKLCIGNKYHLSTYMTPDHRSEVIKRIKADLASRKKVVVISTSLIEAGVDIDFEAVFREIAGIDNILQTAGRCNREGLRKIGYVFVFEFEGDMPKGAEIKLKANITRNLIEEYNDIGSPECISEYYRRIFNFYDEEIDKNSISNMNSSKRIDSIPFRTYADNFKFIDSDSINIVIENKENSKLIERLKFGDLSVKRKLSKNCASVHFREFEEMMKLGIVDDFKSKIFVLTNNDYYKSDIGLDIDSDNDYIN